MSGKAADPAEDQGSGIDWPGMMRLGLGTLRLAPEHFWAMTPREFLRALEGAGIRPFGTAAPMDRDRLQALMRAFPDQQK